MQGYIILAWLLIASIIGLNFVAAGVAALLHIWRGEMQRGTRILLSGTAAGLFPGSLIVAVTLEELMSGERLATMLAVAAMVLAVGGALSLPLAAIVTRKLDGGGNTFRAFE